ncbi:MAG TPA: helix-turn-helix transcriptional regulator [Candidatus Limnocylindrales bacterium]|nr:helix-turn-helix transcriptional regulator [Candidatus Limnocylindrales bacterium]
MAAVAAAEPDTAGALHILGLVAESRGEFAVAERWYRRSLETAHAQLPAKNANPAHVAAAAAHNARAALVAQAALGCVLLAQGDHEGARAHLESALVGHRGTIGSRLNETQLVANLCVANLRRDVRRARRLAGEALKLAVESGNAKDVPEVLGAVAVIAVHLGLDAPAGRLFGAAEAAHVAAGTVFSPTAATVHARARDLGRLHLSRMAFDSATSGGRELSLEAAADLAQRVINAKSTRLPCGLTRREVEVADLVGTGLTNKQIAQRMVLGERTIDTHVTHIRAKLGALTREDIAAWAAHRRLHGDPDPM